MPPLEGVSLEDFKEDDLNTEGDGHVALHHRLEPQGPISALLLSLLWPRALLRAAPREVFLSTTRCHVCGGSLLHADLGVCDLLDHVALRMSTNGQQGAL